MDLPQRISLVAQVTEILRSDLRRGEWRERLPGEIPLSERLQVSRPTLRAALAVLCQEGLVEVTQGKRRRLTPKATERISPAPVRTVGFLTGDPLYALTPLVAFLIDELRKSLQKAGFALELHADRRFGGTRPSRALRELTASHHARCWVMNRASRETQFWCQDHGYKAIVLGSCHQGIRFPSIGVNYHAVCHHAVGRLLGKGHRHIALLIPVSRLAGDLASEQAFLEACRERQGWAKGGIYRHDATVRGIREAMARLLRARPRATAILVSHALHALTVVCHLLQAGLRIPRDISVVLRDGEPLLDYLTPSMTCYRPDRLSYRQRLCRMVLQLARTGILARRPMGVLPRFLSGESLGPAPHL